MGPLVDLALDTDYTIHTIANGLNLRSEKITVVHGVNGMITNVATKKMATKKLRKLMKLSAVC